MAERQCRFSPGLKSVGRGVTKQMREMILAFMIYKRGEKCVSQPSVVITNKEIAFLSVRQHLYDRYCALHRLLVCQWCGIICGCARKENLYYLGEHSFNKSVASQRPCVYSPSCVAYYHWLTLQKTINKLAQLSSLVAFYSHVEAAEGEGVLQRAAEGIACPTWPHVTKKKTLQGT